MNIGWEVEGTMKVNSVWPTEPTMTQENRNHLKPLKKSFIKSVRMQNQQIILC